jgi:hypothetical protein
MGRPSKIESLKKKLASCDPDVKQLFEELLAAEIKDLKDENKAIKKGLDAPSVPQKKSGYKFVPSNTKVKVRSNIDGKYIFSHNKGKINVFLTIPNYNDVVDLDYDEVKVINNAKGNIFKSGMLSIEEVMSEDANITLEDVYADLRISKLYKNKYNPTNFEDLFGMDVSYQVFEKYLLENKEVAETVMIISAILYKQGRLNDNSKMEFFKRHFNNKNLYR